MPVRIRRGAIAGAIVLIAALVAGLLLIQALRPHVSKQTATSIALGQLRQMNSSVTGYGLVSSRYDLSSDRIYDDNGNLIYSQSRSDCRLLRLQVPTQLCAVDPVWVLHLHAPAQGIWVSYDAYVVVNASSGNVSSASLVGR